MQILILTQAVDRDDPILGFFHAWIGALAGHCTRVIVVCLRKGAYDLPDNVEVIQLSGASRLRRALSLVRLSWRYRFSYDSVFVHMSPEFSVASGWLWRLLGKRTALWYVHKSRTITLRVALALSDVVFSVARSTFPIPTDKLVVTGHGIDTDAFSYVTPKEWTGRIITVGRTSAKKQTRIIAESIIAFASSQPAVLDVYGAPVTAEERAYEKDLAQWLREHDHGHVVHLRGPLQHDEVAHTLPTYDAFVSLSETGGVDKALLEAMAVGVPVIASSQPHAELLSPIDPKLVTLATSSGVADALAHVASLQREERTHVSQRLRDAVVQNHSLGATIQKIIWTLSASK